MRGDDASGGGSGSPSPDDDDDFAIGGGGGGGSEAGFERCGGNGIGGALAEFGRDGIGGGIVGGFIACDAEAGTIDLGGGIVRGEGRAPAVAPDVAGLAPEVPAPTRDGTASSSGSVGSSLSPFVPTILSSSAFRSGDPGGGGGTVRCFFRPGTGPDDSVADDSFASVLGESTDQPDASSAIRPLVSSLRSLLGVGVGRVGPDGARARTLAGTGVVRAIPVASPAAVRAGSIDAGGVDVGFRVSITGADDAGFRGPSI